MALSKAAPAPARQSRNRDAVAEYVMSPSEIHQYLSPLLVTDSPAMTTIIIGNPN
jgi:hypothetical protein